MSHHVCHLFSFRFTGRFVSSWQKVFSITFNHDGPLDRWQSVLRVWLFALSLLLSTPNWTHLKKCLVPFCGKRNGYRVRSSWRVLSTVLCVWTKILLLRGKTRTSTAQHYVIEQIGIGSSHGLVPVQLISPILILLDSSVIMSFMRSKFSLHIKKVSVPIDIRIFFNDHHYLYDNGLQQHLKKQHHIVALAR